MTDTPPPPLTDLRALAEAATRASRCYCLVCPEKRALIDACTPDAARALESLLSALEHATSELARVEANAVELEEVVVALLALACSSIPEPYMDGEIAAFESALGLIRATRSTTEDKTP